ncbi:UNVERIFIED_CONTAM: hypothetical protein NY603_34410, partial [Bacteroidetes bacterium 56_B9]
MIAEAMVYKLLTKDKRLKKLMDEIRGREFGGGYDSGIFTYIIPENAVSVTKPEIAPFIRINPN